MTTTATRIAGPQTVTTGAGNVSLGTVPAGVRWLIRGLVIVNTSLSVATGISVKINGTADSNLVYRTIAIAPASSVNLDPWWVLNAGEQIYAIATATNPTVSLMGYVLPV